MNKAMAKAVRAAMAATALASMTPTGVLAQDAIWEHQQRVQQQQAEERRINDLASGMYDDSDPDDGPGGEGNAPGAFAAFPPAAWADWVLHDQDVQRRNEEERLAKDPEYRALAQGTWTYRDADAKQSDPTCQATFWTRNGGVSFIHIGGKVELTLLGYFGARIPSAKPPRTIPVELIQSGQVQKVHALNLQFGSMGSVGMVLFNVHSPKILLDAIEDRQDFELRLDGKSIAQGEWHSGLAARDRLAACLKGQGVSTAR